MKLGFNLGAEVPSSAPPSKAPATEREAAEAESEKASPLASHQN
jgi:hypothetical protein